MSITETKKSVGQAVWTPIGGATNMSGYVGSRKIPGDYQLILEYATNGVVRGCCDLNAKRVAGADLDVFRRAPAAKGKRLRKGLRRKSDAQYEEVEEHPIFDLLNRANDSINGNQLFFLTSVYLDVLGRAYWYVERNDYDQTPARIWVLMPQCVTPETDADGNVISYGYAPGGAPGTKASFAAADVIDFRLPNLTNPYWGAQSPLASVYSQVTISSKMADYLSSILDNRGRPEIIISPKDPNAVVDDNAARQLLSRWNNRLSNRGNGGAIVLDAAIDVEEVGYSPTDLAPIQIDEHTQSAVAFALGIPEPLLRGNASTYSNYETAKAIHAETTVLPRLRLIAAKINERILPMFGDDGDGVCVEFENVVPADKDYALKEAAERRASLESAAKLRVVEEGDGGVLTENEARELLGLAPVDGGDLRYVGVAPPAPAMPPTGSQPQPPADGGGDDAPADPIVPADGEAADEGDDAEGADDAEASKRFDVDALLRLNEAVAKGTLSRAAAISFAARAFRVKEAEARHWVCDPNPKPKTPQTGTKAACGCGCGATTAAPDDDATATEAPAERRAKALPPLDKTGEKIKGTVGGYFRQLKAEAVAVLDGKGEKSADDGDLTGDLAALFNKADDTGNLPSAFVELERWANKLRGKSGDLAHQVKPLIEMSVKESADGKADALVRAGASPDAFAVMPAKIADATDQRAYTFADSTMATTRDDLQTAINGVKDRIKQGLEDGDPVDVMRQAVAEVFDNAETYQTERIARTEASAAVHSGQLIAAKESGIVKAMRPLISDDACERCKDQGDAGEVALGDIDDSGSVTAEGVPPYHPNCTCTWTEVIDLGDE